MQVERIVSLVPSLTELVCGVGLQHKLIGITKFCTDPPNLRVEKQQVGGTKNAHLERIYALKPDLVLAAKEENTKTDVEALAQTLNTFTVDIKALADMQPVLDLLLTIGGDAQIIKQLLSFVSQPAPKVQHPIRALYLIWQKPYMAVGGGTYISDMLTHGGFLNCMESFDRYPEISLAQIALLEPDVILLSSEPFPFKELHRRQLELETNTRCVLVNGQWFSWYDSRVVSHLSNIRQLANTLH